MVRENCILWINNAVLFIIFIGVAMLLAYTRVAVGAGVTATVRITATISATTSCTFNQSGTLTIDYGTVKLRQNQGTYLLDGDYTRPLTTAFTCSGDPGGLLQMRFTSAGGQYETYSGDGSKVLGTDTGVVGVQLLVDGSVQDMGEWFTVDRDSQPALTTKLVSLGKTDTVSSGDTFAATGTLTLAFN